MCTGYGIAFDQAGLWNVGNDFFASNIVIFGVDNESSCQPDSR